MYETASAQRTQWSGGVCEYNFEFKKNKISLDFCLAHAYLFIGVRESPKVDFSSAMEKKREQHFNYDDIKANKYFNKNKKVDLL